MDGTRQGERIAVGGTTEKIKYTTADITLIAKTHLFRDPYRFLFSHSVEVFRNKYGKGKSRFQFRGEVIR